MARKKVAINTDFVFSKTGLGRNGKEIVKYLIGLNKYDIIYYASGIQWNHPELKKLPFDCVGTLPESAEECEKLKQSPDPSRLRDASYGVDNIDRFIREYKPDVMIFSNDSWAFPYWKRPWWQKFNCILHITLDSLPFLPVQIEQIQNSKNYFVWADFAEKEAKRLGFNHVKTLTGMINNDCFRRLIEAERTGLRIKNNIPVDAFVVGFVFRSQLRKELRPLMEGFAQFKRQNPEIKNPRLLLHTNFSEGWDIPRLANEFGIEQKEILTTYICRKCGHYEIKPFQGQDLKCDACSFDKAQVTCNPTNGITEEELNDVYNIMDCYCHLMNAGGLEIPIIEAMYAGLPVATVAYSSGEKFTDQPFVYSVDFAWTVQMGTQFRRAAPSANSVAKFLRKIANLDANERIEIGRKSSQWALSVFSPSVVGKQWEELIDSMPEIDYDYNFGFKPKNPNYPMPNIQSDEMFISDLYANILNMDEPPSGDGHKNWMHVLKNGGTRQQVYDYFVKVASEENAKNQPISLESFFEDNGKKRALFVLKESIGDHFLFTSLIASARIKYPEHDIYVAADPKYHEIYSGNPDVKKVISYMPIMEQELYFIGPSNAKKIVDVYCNVGIFTQRILNYLSNDYTLGVSNAIFAGNTI